MTAVNDRARFLIIDDHPLFREALHSAVPVSYTHLTLPTNREV